MTLKSDIRQAIAAHNKKLECSTNDNWNKANKCGTNACRSICRSIAYRKTGEGSAKITWKDAVEWSQSMLPTGAGYPSQDITPSNEPYVMLLRASV